MNINRLFLRLVSSLLGAVIVAHSSSIVIASSISLSNAPVSLTKSQSYQVNTNYQSSGNGIVQVQLFDSSWNLVTSDWGNVTSGTSSKSFNLTIPSSTANGSGYRWQAVLYNPSWVKLDEEVVSPVTVSSSGPSISFNAPLTVAAGSNYTVSTNYNLSGGGIVQLQFFDASWNLITSDWRSVSASSGTESFTLTIPSSTSAGGGYLWQALLYNPSWAKKDEVVAGNVTVQAGQGAEWTPAGSWQLEWADEFSGTGEPAAWYPMLGYDPDSFANDSEKGLRWTGSTDYTSQMYSTRSGNHWLNGQGQLVIRAIVDKSGPNNAHGKRVKSAYLMSGFPDQWDSSEPNGVKWGGKFVSPKNGPLYISARVRSDKVVGYSTWFAFWLFSQTRAYNGTPADGTEVDMIEIAKGAPSYMNKSFNVANHWAQSNGSESAQFSTGTNPSSTSFVDVTDSNYHTYGIEWTQSYMKCSVDGQVYYTFTNNIPTDPVDMMMLLTMEFQKNAWDPNQGDGRTAGPYVSDNSTMREMSRALIDYVRVYRKQ